MTSHGDLSLADRLERIEAKLDVLVEQVTILKAKAGLYGAAAGALIVILLEKVL